MTAYRPATDQIRAIRDQASRYLAATHGDDWIYRPPEDFPALEQWIRALAGGDLDHANLVMTRLAAHHIAQRHGLGGDQ